METLSEHHIVRRFEISSAMTTNLFTSLTAHGIVVTQMLGGKNNKEKYTDTKEVEEFIAFSAC